MGAAGAHPYRRGRRASRIPAPMPPLLSANLWPHPTSCGPGELAGDRFLNGCDFSEPIAQIAASDGVELLRIEVVVGLDALLELVHLVLQTEGGEEIVGLTQRPGV